MRAKARLASVLAAIFSVDRSGGIDFQTTSRSDYEALRRRDLWDFAHIPAQREEGPGWLRHRFGDSPDGEGGSVQLDYSHRLVGGGRHRLHNTDQHDDLTHVGCSGNDIHLRYASGSSQWSRQLAEARGAAEGDDLRRDTLLLPHPWGCSPGLQPEGGHPTLYTILRRTCLEADAQGCLHHHIEVQPAHLLEVFEDLGVEFHWVPGTEVREDSNEAAPPQESEGEALRAPARRLRTYNERYAMEDMLELDSAQEMKESCRGGRIPGSNTWLVCPRDTFGGRGYCYCPAGSWYDQEQGHCAYWGCELVFNTCDQDGVPIPTSNYWLKNCQAYGSQSCYDNHFCCCPKGEMYLEATNRCCSCTNATECDLPEAWKGDFNTSLVNVGPSLTTMSKPRGGWGINFDSYKDPPVVHPLLDIGKDMICVNCFAGIKKVEVHYKINLVRMLLLEFVVNVSFPVEFNMQLRLKTETSTQSPETKEQVLKWPFPGLMLAGVLNLAPFLSLDVALQYIAKLKACNISLPDFYMRSTQPARWTYGVAYHKHSASGPRTYKEGPHTADIKHNLNAFTHGSVKELLQAIGRDWDVIANMTWKIEPMFIVGLDVAGLTDVGVALQLPFPVSMDAEVDIPENVHDGLHRIGAAGMRFVGSNSSDAQHRRLESDFFNGAQAPNQSIFEEDFEPAGAAGASAQLGTEKELRAEFFWQDSFMEKLNSPRESYLQSVAMEDYIEICYGFVVKKGAFELMSVKLEARLEPNHVAQSELRPRGADGQLSLCGCTAPMPLNQLLFEDKFKFAVLHDPIADELVGQTKLPEDEEDYSGFTDPDVNTGVELIATLMTRVGHVVLEEGTLDLFPDILTKKRLIKHHRYTWVWLEWRVAERRPDKDLADFDLEEKSFDGTSHGLTPDGEEPSEPSLTVIDHVLRADERWEHRVSKGACETSKEGKGRRLADDAGAFHSTSHMRSAHEDQSPLGPVTLGATIRRQMQMALVWSGIRINRRWLQNAMEVAGNIMLQVATAGQATWVAPWVQGFWDKTSPLLRKSMPVSRRWRWQVVPYMYTDSALTGETQYHFDVCDVLAKYTPWLPCWLFLWFVILVAGITVYIQIRYCSCLTPFFGCWPCNRICTCKLPNSVRSGRRTVTDEEEKPLE